jgi:type IV secretory pathway VirB2 component (pilin)
MARQAAVVLYVLALVAVIVGVDILFFSHHFWEQLTITVGIVLVFAALDIPEAPMTSPRWRIGVGVRSSGAVSFCVV